MHPVDLATLAAFHKYHQDQPTTAGQVGWQHTQEQALRFRVLAEVGTMAGHTVLDAGCGLADLWAYLAGHDTPAHYTGFDCLPRFVNQARQRWQHEPRVSVGAGDLLQPTLPTADYVLACGSLSYPSQNPNSLYAALRNLWQHSRKALAFNLLRSTPTERYLCTYHPEEIEAYCRTLSPHVVLRTDYAPDDFTLYVYRNPIAP